MIPCHLMPVSGNCCVVSCAKRNLVVHFKSRRSRYVWPTSAAVGQVPVAAGTRSAGSVFRRTYPAFSEVRFPWISLSSSLPPGSQPAVLYAILALSLVLIYRSTRHRELRPRRDGDVHDLHRLDRMERERQLLGRVLRYADHGGAFGALTELIVASACRNGPRSQPDHRHFRLVPAVRQHCVADLAGRAQVLPDARRSSRARP